MKMLMQFRRQRNNEIPQMFTLGSLTDVWLGARVIAVVQIKWTAHYSSAKYRFLEALEILKRSSATGKKRSP